MSSPDVRRWRELLPADDSLVGGSSSSYAAERTVLYQDLLSFESRILEEMERQVGSLSDAVRREIEAINLEPLRNLIEELRRRRDSWAARQDPAAS